VPPKKRRRSKSRDPMWARLMVVFGAVLSLLSGLAVASSQVVISRYSSSIDTGDLIEDDDRADNDGRVRPGQAVNVLLVGIDTRVGSGEPIRADSIILLHVPKEHDRAFLVSIPRDLIVEIPAKPPVKQVKSRERINAAYAYGDQDGGGRAGGVKLLSTAISDLTGIKFDAAAIVDFEGFQAVVEALGGVHMCIDQRVESIHIGTDRKGNFLSPSRGGKPVVYEVGCRDLKAWEALDYVRQRHLPNGDYDRQRHQQQFLRAMLKKAASKGVITDPKKLDAVVRAGGKALTLDDGGIPPHEWLWAMRNVGDNEVLMLRTPGGGVFGAGGEYVGEELTAQGKALFDAMRTSTLDQFAVANTDLVNTDR
jgi:LCP family protein required for cell wall assembly